MKPRWQAISGTQRSYESDENCVSAYPFDSRKDNPQSRRYRIFVDFLNCLGLEQLKHRQFFDEWT